MKELSLNILDITMNSVKAGAENISISLCEDADGILTVTISDDGCGMDETTLHTVTDPFYTTRTTRKVGMGVPLFKLASEQTGGKFSISSVCEKDDPINHGTVISASFDTKSIDFAPLGDIVGTVCVLIQGNPETDFLFRHSFPGGEVTLDTKELKTILGDVPLNSFEIIEWIKDYLNEQYMTARGLI